MSGCPTIRHYGHRTNYNALYVYILHFHTDQGQHKFIYSENNTYFVWREAIAKYREYTTGRKQPAEINRQQCTLQIRLQVRAVVKPIGDLNR